MISLMIFVGLLMSISLCIWMWGITYKGEYPKPSHICRTIGFSGYVFGIVVTILYITGRLAWVFNYRYFNF